MRMSATVSWFCNLKVNTVALMKPVRHSAGKSRQSGVSNMRNRIVQTGLRKRLK